MSSIEQFGYRQELKRSLSFTDLLDLRPDLHGADRAVRHLRRRLTAPPAAWSRSRTSSAWSRWCSPRCRTRRWPGPSRWPARSTPTRAGASRAPVGFLAGWVILLDYVLVPGLLYLVASVGHALVRARGAGVGVAGRLRAAQHRRELPRHPDDRADHPDHAGRRAHRAGDLPGHRRGRAGAGQGQTGAADPAVSTPTPSPGRWSSARCRSRCCRSSASTASRCWPRRTGRTRGRSAGRWWPRWLLAGVLFIVQTWVAALLVPDRGRPAGRGRPGGHRLLRRGRVAGGAWLGVLTRRRHRHRLGLRQLAGRPGRHLAAAVRDGPRPAAARASWPRSTPSTRCRPTPRSWSPAVSLVLGLYMATRDDGHHAAQLAGQLRRDDRVPAAARRRGRALRRAAAQPRLVRAPGRAGDRLRDPGARRDQRQRRRPGARLRLARPRAARPASCCTRWAAGPAVRAGHREPRGAS